MKRYAPMLLLVLPFVVVQLRDPNAPRTIDVTLSRYAFSPERIEVELGERVSLNVVSLDVAHGFQVKELGLNVRVPAGGRRNKPAHRWPWRLWFRSSWRWLDRVAGGGHRGRC